MTQICAFKNEKTPLLMDLVFEYCLLNVQYISIMYIISLISCQSKVCTIPLRERLVCELSLL